MTGHEPATTWRATVSVASSRPMQITAVAIQFSGTSGLARARHCRVSLCGRTVQRRVKDSQACDCYRAFSVRVETAVSSRSPSCQSG